MADIFIVQDRENNEIVGIFGSRREFDAWWEKQQFPVSRFDVTWKELEVSSKQVLTTI